MSFEKAQSIETALKVLRTLEVLHRADATIAAQHIQPLRFDFLKLIHAGRGLARRGPRPARAGSLRRPHHDGCPWDARRFSAIGCLHTSTLYTEQQNYIDELISELRKPRRDMNQEYVEWYASRVCFYADGMLRVSFPAHAPYMKHWNELTAYRVSPSKLATLIKDWLKLTCPR